MIKKGTTEIANVKKGSSQITKVLKGTSLIWENWRAISGANLLAQNITLSTITATSSIDPNGQSQAIGLASPYAGKLFRNPTLSVTQVYSHSGNHSYDGDARVRFYGVKQDDGRDLLFDKINAGSGTYTGQVVVTNDVAYKAIVVYHEAWVWQGEPGSYTSKITAGIMTACEVKG